MKVTLVRVTRHHQCWHSTTANESDFSQRDYHQCLHSTTASESDVGQRQDITTVGTVPQPMKVMLERQDITSVGIVVPLLLKFTLVRNTRHNQSLGS